MKEVCILDYGSGNVGSVFNLIRNMKYKCNVSNDPKIIKKSTHIILPGVGSFGEAMKKIKKKLPLKIIEDEVLNKKKPFLGICVGMQVLAEKGEEFGIHVGLGWIKGRVKKIRAKKLPHIGWNNLLIKKKSLLVDGIQNNDDFYFVNSFYFEISEKKNIIANTKYHHSFCSVVQKQNIFGTQFHPEKSQNAGKKLIANFLNF